MQKIEILLLKYTEYNSTNQPINQLIQNVRILRYQHFRQVCPDRGAEEGYQACSCGQGEARCHGEVLQLRGGVR